MDIFKKTQPFDCYYCHKTIKDDTQAGHISTCGSVLEPCPKKCGSYIPRNMRSRHMKECVNNRSKSMSRLSSDSHDTHFSNHTDKTSNISGVSLGLNNQNNRTPTSDMQKGIQEEIYKMATKLKTLEQLTQQVQSNVNTIKNRNIETMQNQQNVKMQLQLNSEKLHFHSQTTQEWKKSLDLQMDQVKQEMRIYNTHKAEAEKWLQNLQDRLRIMEKFENDLTLLNSILVQEQIFNRESRHDFDGKLKEFKDFFTVENATIGALWQDHKSQIEHLSRTCSNLQKNIDEQKNRQANLTFDLRAATQICTETSEKLEIKEKNIAAINKQLTQIKLDVEALEDVVSNYTSRAVSATPGRLLWKISDFSHKMENAKENDTVLRSQIFFTHDYGYKIRLEIYLNGIRKWKGRHMIACIQVLKGECDLLLKWPCFIEGIIKVCDLHDRDHPKDVVKPITAKRTCGNEENEDPQESSPQYIFIPHTTLLKEKYLKDDTMFIEVIINRTNKQHNETEL